MVRLIAAGLSLLLGLSCTVESGEEPSEVSIAASDPPKLSNPTMNDLWTQLGSWDDSGTPVPSRLTAEPIPYAKRSNFAFDDPGGHIQGVARYKGWHLMTHDAPSSPGFLVAISPGGVVHKLAFELPLESVIDVDLNGVIDASDTLTPADFRHPGGVQVLGDVLGVPFGGGSNDSRRANIVRFFDLRPIIEEPSFDASNPNSTLTLRRFSQFPDIYAGNPQRPTHNSNAVGMVNLGTDIDPRIVVAVQMWLSVKFYESTESGWRFMFEIESPPGENSESQIFCVDDSLTWCRAQSIALLRHGDDDGGGLALLTFMSPKNSNGIGWLKDRVNLYSVDLGASTNASRVVFRGRLFPPVFAPVMNNVRLTYGAGVALREDGTLGLLATDRNLCDATQTCPGLVEYRDIGWDSPAKKYSTGRELTVASNRNYAVEIHRSASDSTSNKDKLYYRVGVFENETPTSRRVAWTPLGVWQDEGKTPSVAMDDDGNVVAVYQAANGLDLFGCTGRVAPGPVLLWDNNCREITASSREPSVSMNNNGQVVLVQRGSTDYLYARVGTFSRVGGQPSSFLSFSPSRRWGTDMSSESTKTGMEPSVGVDDSGVIVTTHNGQEGTDKEKNLYVGVARISNSAQGQFVDFVSPPRQLTTGYHSDVALEDEGRLLVTHTGTSESAGTLNNVYLRIGVLTAGSWNISWVSGSNYAVEGRGPDVSMDGDGRLSLVFRQKEGNNSNDVKYLIGDWGAVYENRRRRVGLGLN